MEIAISQNILRITFVDTDARAGVSGYQLSAHDQRLAPAYQPSQTFGCSIFFSLASLGDAL